MPLHESFNLFNNVQGFSTLCFDESGVLLHLDSHFPFLAETKPPAELGQVQAALLPWFADELNLMSKALKFGGISNWFVQDILSHTDYQCIMYCFERTSADSSPAKQFTLGLKPASSRKTNQALIPLLIAAMDSLTEGLTLADCAEEDSPLIYANQRFMSLSEYSSAQLLGRNCRFIQIESAQNNLAKHEIRHAMKHGLEVTVNLENKKRSGEIFNNSLSLSPIKDAKGKPSHYIGLQRDVTLQKKLKSELTLLYQKQQALFYRAPLPLYITDSAGIILDSNAQLATFIGLPQEALIGRNQFSFFDPQQLADLHGLNESNFFSHLNTHLNTRLNDHMKAHTHKDESIELELIKNNASRAWVVFRCIDLLQDREKTDDEAQYLCSLTGIELTKQAQLEQFFLIEKLSQSNFQLEHLAHMASHDLQVPLNKCCNYLYLLEESMESGQIETGFIEKAIKVCMDMKQLIKTTLISAKPESDFEDMTRVDLNLILAMSLSLVEEILIKSDASLEVEDLNPVLGSMTELTRVFQNLINNAVKYRSSKPLKIRIFDESTADQTLISIDDNGQGIPQASSEAIFEFRTQVNHESLGQGLGLSICKSIMKKHNGSISLAPSYLGGSRFVLAFPKVL